MKKLLLLIAALVISTASYASETQVLQTPPQKLDLAVFGDLNVTNRTPVIQLQFPYDINTEIVTPTTHKTGTITTSNGILTVSSGTDTDSYAYVQSRKFLQYRPGQGVYWIGAGFFDPCVAGNQRFIGMGDIGDGIGYGCVGAEFGISRAFGGKNEVWGLSIDSDATASGDITITLAGNAKVIPVINGDTRAEIVTKIVTTSTWSELGDGWRPFRNGMEVVFKALIDGHLAGAFSFVDTDTTGVTGALTEQIHGVATSFAFTPQSEFSNDKLSWLDITKGNVYRVRFQWLGFGMLTYEIEEPHTGQFIIAHQEAYANSYITPSVRNPIFPLGVRNVNTGGTSTTTVNLSSAGAFVEGINSPSTLEYSASSPSISVTTTELPLLSICNRIVYGGVAPNGTINRISVDPDFLSMLADGVKGVVITISKNSDLTGLPLFVNEDTANSVTSVDVGATGITLGRVIASFGLDKVDSDTQELLSRGVSLRPGETFHVSAHTLSGTNADVSCTLSWRENF
jgi:hypothetical protein